MRSGTRTTRPDSPETPGNRSLEAFTKGSPLAAACDSPVAALALLVEACERNLHLKKWAGESDLRPYLDAGAEAVRRARREELAPDPHYSCGAAYCDDPACVTHNHDHPNHDD